MFALINFGGFLMGSYAWTCVNKLSMMLTNIFISFYCVFMYLCYVLFSLCLLYLLPFSPLCFHIPWLYCACNFPHLVYNSLFSFLVADAPSTPKRMKKNSPKKKTLPKKKTSPQKRGAVIKDKVNNLCNQHQLYYCNEEKPR